MVCDAKYTGTGRLDGKIAVITGANTGIGKMTALDFYKRGAHVELACRNIEKANATLKEIKEICKNDTNVGTLEVVELNLSSLSSVRNCANILLNKLQRIDLLINNAGIMMTPYSKTEDGFEIQFGTNHLGHFLFTLLLLPKIIKSTPARIINLSSVGHKYGTIDFKDLHWEKKSYKPFPAYGQSKLGNILFTKELARRLEEANITGVTVYSVHPGAVATDIDRHVDETYFRGLSWMFRGTFGRFVKTPMQGAQTTIYCAVDENVGKETGLYYAECKEIQPAKKAKNMDDAKRLWEVSFEMVGLEQNFDPFKI